MTQEQLGPLVSAEEEQESRSYSEQDSEEITSKVMRRTLTDVPAPTRKKGEKWYNRRVWQFIGAFLTGVGILISIVFFVAQREIKSITITVLTNTSLASIADTVAEDIQLLYKGSPIPGLFLVQLKLANDGNVEIRSTDYEKPITLVFSPESTVVDAVVVEEEPSGIGLILNWEDNQVILTRSLLNKGDRVIIQVLVVHPSDQVLELQAQGRIAGIREIRVGNVLQQEPVIDFGQLDSPWLVLLVISGIVLLAVVLALIFFKGEARPPA